MMDMKDESESSAITFSSQYISDTIQIRTIPEKRGTFLKHTEYEITSEKFKSKVERRYSDFVSLLNLLMQKYNGNRMIPRIPPKQLMLESFIEERRRGLQRWLRLMSHHPFFSTDEIFKTFLTITSGDHLNQMQNVFVSDPDEFLHYSDSKLLHGNMDQMLEDREFMRSRLNHVMKLKRILEQQAQREMNQSKDFAEMSLIMNSMCDAKDDNLKDFSESFLEISKESEKVSTNQQQAVKERISMLVDVLTAYSDLCERVEKNFISRNSDISEIEFARRKTFSLSCVNEETKFAQQYLKLLPSILLQFSNEEAKGFKNISDAFSKIVQVESDKMN